MKKLVLSILLTISAAVSQACQPGVPGSGPSGDPNCMGPIVNSPGYYGNSNQRSSSPPTRIIETIIVHKPSKYGALALSDKTGDVAGAINANSKTEAKREAIRRCESNKRNGSCKIITWVRNGCVAAATGKSGKVWKLFKAAEKPGRAEQVAMNRCTASGASGCKILMPEGCSVPEGMYN
ncbi:DUF4189 domain-containing protein [Neisseria sp.]|uniref:DUF4189 domain-containing protein n=1 Tax=Neisseria sp. TaxID=192066 RepID=UPI0035A09893